jgi:hypothetical protein
LLQLLLGLIKDLLHWLLKYQKAGNEKDRFGNQFTLETQYAGHQPFLEPFHSMKSSSWRATKIRGMIGALAVNCAPILNCSKDDRITTAETAFDEIVMGSARALCELSLLVSQQNHSDLSRTVQDDALTRLYKTKGGFREQKMWKSAKAQVDDRGQENSISYAYKRVIKSEMQWKFRCTGLKRIQQQNKGNFRCV